MAREPKIGIFGGTFNPIHYGHLRAAEEIREKARLDKILFVPAGNPPLKTEDIAEAAHRYEMVRLAVAGNPSFDISDIECRKSGKSYTVNTVEDLRRQAPRSRMLLILGVDAFLDLPNWWKPELLLTLCDFIIIRRPGFRFTDLKDSIYLDIGENPLNSLHQPATETFTAKLKSGRNALLLALTQLDISSTEVRRLIKRGKSIKYLLPPEVQSYIITNELYAS